MEDNEVFDLYTDELSKLPLNHNWYMKLVFNFKMIQKVLDKCGVNGNFVTEDELKKVEKALQKSIESIVLPMPDTQPGVKADRYIDNYLVDRYGQQYASLYSRTFALINAALRDRKDSHQDYVAGLPMASTTSQLLTPNYVALSSLRQAKKIGIIGDSIAAGSHAKYNFGDIFNQQYGCEIQNLAKGGATMANYSQASIVNQAPNLSNCDVVIIQGTDDDWLNNVTIGEASKQDTQTYLGALMTTIDQVKVKNKTAKLIFVTASLQAPTGDSGLRRTDQTKNKLGLTLHDYMDAEKTALANLNLPYVDLMSSFDGFEPLNPAYRKAMMSEGLHFNEVGHQWLAQLIARNFGWFYG